MGAAERAEANRSRGGGARRLAVGRRARRATSRRAAWLAGVELYLDRYAEADAHANRALAVARATGQGELFLRPRPRPWAGSGASGASWPRPRELLDGGIEAARLLGNTHALVWNLSGRSAAALRSGRRGARARHRPGERRPQPGRRRGLPLGRGGRRPRRRAARDRATGACGRAARSSPPAARSWCSSPGARGRVPSRC